MQRANALALSRLGRPKIKIIVTLNVSLCPLYMDQTNDTTPFQHLMT